MIPRFLFGLWLSYLSFYVGYVVTNLMEVNHLWFLPEVSVCCELSTMIPLYIHVGGGLVVLLVGPFQLLSSVYRPKVHRWTGLIYLNGCIAAAGGGLVLLLFDSTYHPNSVVVPFAIYNALLFVYVTSAVYYAATGDLGRHSRWAVRSYYLGNALPCYLILYLAVNGKMDFQGAELANWIFYLAPLGLAEIQLRLVQ